VLDPRPVCRVQAPWGADRATEYSSGWQLPVGRFTTVNTDKAGQLAVLLAQARFFLGHLVDDLDVLQLVAAARFRERVGPRGTGWQRDTKAFLQYR